MQLVSSSFCPGNWFRWTLVAACCIGPCWAGNLPAARKITDSVTLYPGAVNRIVISQDPTGLAIYGAPAGWPGAIDHVLFTHHRRDVVWAGRPAVERGAKSVVPSRSREWFEQPGVYWQAFLNTRFHDYQPQTTKILAAPMRVDIGVLGGDEFAWREITIKVIDTPGYTREAVSYLVELDEKRLAFTGDLIHGSGQIFDLYSFQDAIPEAGLRGYHGYGARLAALMNSLEKIADLQPDILLPARGPIIDKPIESINRLRERLRALYRNYLETSALHWYFKQPHIRKCLDRMLGPGEECDSMPFSPYRPAPEWILSHSTSRLIYSESGYGFLIDCGYSSVIDFVQRLIDQGSLLGVEGIFVTHYHDDHTDAVAAAAERFSCPVYSGQPYREILEQPGSFRMPALTAHPITGIKPLAAGETLTWHEYRLTYQDFPGQTLYHGALLAAKPGEDPVFFIGDSFTPSGLDDYCVLNRNFVGDDQGYLHCLKLVKTLAPQTWLANQHVAEVFKFNPRQLEFMESHYRARWNLLEQLLPHPHVNFGLDEQWIRFHPHAQTATRGGPISGEIRLWNHDRSPNRFQILIHPPKGWRVKPETIDAVVSGRQKMRWPIEWIPDSRVKPGIHVATLDVHTQAASFHEWTETILEIPPESPVK